MFKKIIYGIVYCISRAVAVGFITVSYRIKHYGTENVPKNSAYLLLSNHQSFLDPMFCQSGIRRRLVFVARDSLWQMPVLGRFISMLSAIPIKRGQADLKCIKEIISLLKGGRSVCIYPEATRTRDGRIAEIKAGFGIVIKRARVPVIPMVIEGAFEAWPRDKKLPGIGHRISIEYGRPIGPEKLSELGEEKFAELVTSTMRQMQNHCRKNMGREPFDYSVFEGQQCEDAGTETQENVLKDKS